MAVLPKHTPNGDDNIEDAHLPEDPPNKIVSSKSRNMDITRGHMIWAFITVTIMLITSSTLIAVYKASAPEKYGIIFSKKEWGGKPPLNVVEPLHHPTTSVLVSHTAGTPCANFTECATTLRLLQAHHVEHLQSTDIEYNFLIGGDGNIYVGRGWDVKSSHNNLDISFIGNYHETAILTKRMLEALKKLLDLGVKLNKLAPNYKLVGHNQTYTALSPDKKVFKEIDKFIPKHVEIPS